MELTTIQNTRDLCRNIDFSENPEALACPSPEFRGRNDYVEALIAAVAEGDKNALAALYKEVSTDVYAYALSKTKNKADAEDVLSDTFVQIYKYAKRYENMGKPMAWILTIATNLINRQFNLKNRSVSLEDNQIAVDGSNYIESSEQTTVNNLYVKEMLAKLNEEEREVVVLHLVSGLKHREIAKMLDKPLSTILSKYNRAIAKLKTVKGSV